jgi:protein-L-isoaspartate O-methyltransferase
VFGQLKNRIDTLRNWDAGYAIPPTARAKQRFLGRLAQEGGHRVFIESGTLFGDTTQYMLRHCELVTTVELEPTLYERAARRFEGNPAVTVIHGDALDEIPQLVAASPHPPLVWLDGHHSGGGTAVGAVVEPAVEILRALTGVARGTTLVVDDLRMFGMGDMPTLLELVDAASRVAQSVQVGPDNLVIRA